MWAGIIEHSDCIGPVAPTGIASYAQPFFFQELTAIPVGKKNEVGVPEVSVSEEGVWCKITNRHEAFILLKLFHNLFAINFLLLKL